MADTVEAMRVRARTGRRNLAEAPRLAADTAICESAIEVVLGSGSKRISSYLATDGEPDMDGLHTWCRTNDIEVAVPVMVADGQLEFRGLAQQQLRVNRSGIPEPREGSVSELVDLDIVFAPLVIFDEAANRAGRGGGWYDRALSDSPHGQLLVGVAYELQRVDEVPTHNHDVPLDIVITERRSYSRAEETREHS